VLAERAAHVRAERNVRLPDAFAVVTALSARQDHSDARLASFDRTVDTAYRALAG